MKAQGMIFGPSDGREGIHNFFDNNSKYEISNFQRPYVWGKEQIDGVLADINYIAEDPENISVGWPSVLLQEIASGQKPIYEIGDGQQRIISVYLALLSLWHIGETLATNETEIQYLKNIMSHDTNSCLGYILKDEKYNNTIVKPRIEFQDGNVNMALTNLIRKPLSFEEIDQSINSADEKSSLNLAFSIYYKNFSSINNFDTIKKYINIILNKIILTVLIYSPEENMYRSFANMNSFGISLTEGQLIKSLFYGRAIQLDGKPFADEMANYWRKEFETSYWIDKRGSTKQTDNLDIALKQSYLSYNAWNIYNETENIQHILSNHWREKLDKLSSLKELQNVWENLIKDLTLYQIAEGKPYNLSVTSSEWILNYAYNIIIKTAQQPDAMSIFMKLNRSTRPKFNKDHLHINQSEEYKETIGILIKYCFLLFWMDRGTSAFSSNLTTDTQGPLMLDSISPQAIQDFLEKPNYKRSAWDQSEKIKKKIITSSYEDTTKNNSFINETFIYLVNAKKKYGQTTTKSLEEYDAKKSREHILPQSGKNMPSNLTPDEYKILIGRIGNSLFITKNLNSKSRDDTIDKKIAIYEEETGEDWKDQINYVLKIYEENKVWTEKEIDERTIILAEEISNVISTKNLVDYENSFFANKLMDRNSFEAGQIFYVFHKNGETIELTLTEKGYLVDKTKNLLKTMSDLFNIIDRPGANKSYKDLLFVKNNERIIVKLADFSLKD